MVDQVITKEQLIQASQNANSWEKYWDGGANEDVITRLSKKYPTHAKALKIMAETGGFMPFLTEAEREAYVSELPRFVAKVKETSKVWWYENGTWHDTGLSELDQAKADAAAKDATVLANAKTYSDTAITTQSENVTVKNLIVDKKGTIGFLDLSFSPVVDNPTYSKMWVTTEWVDIPLDTTHLLLLGNAYSYSIMNEKGTWYAGSRELSDNNVHTIIDLSIKTNNGTGIAKKIRVSFRRHGTATDDEATTIAKTMQKVAIYPFVGGVGIPLDTVNMSNIKAKRKSDFLIANNLLFLLRTWTSYTGTLLGLKDGYFDTPSNNPTVTGDYYKQWQYTPALAVQEGLTLYYTNNMDSYSVVYLDLNKNPLGIVYTSNASKHTIPIAAYAKEIKYVRLSLRASLVATSSVYLLNDSKLTSLVTSESDEIKIAKSSTLKAIQDAPATQKSNLTNKKWLALGDSITNNPQSYAVQLASRHNAVLTRHTLDGTWVHKGVMSGIPRVLSESFVDIATTTQFDFVTVACAVNDRFNRLTGFTTASTKVYLKDANDKVLAEGATDSTGFFGFEVNETTGLKVTKADNSAVSTTVSVQGSLGVMSDRTTSTFYGALHVLLKGLRDKFPLARIGYISQIQSTWQPYMRNEKNNIAWLKTQAILDVCSYYGIEVWVGCDKFGFNPRDNETLKTAYMPDGLHPNTAGHTWYANRVEQFILSLAS